MSGNFQSNQSECFKTSHSVFFFFINLSLTFKNVKAQRILDKVFALQATLGPTHSSHVRQNRSNSKLWHSFFH